ncbi:MAG: aminotransferase class III-fold pyridoxal phosphate-dependent enzyme [Myxococcota bacterium]
MKKLKLSKSEELYKEALERIPGGVLGIRKPQNFVPGEYPIFLERAKGGRIWDVDGNEFIDMLCGYGPIIIGHREKEIDDAVIAQMEKGFCMDLTQPYQNRLAKKFKELIPCAEMAIFVKTGSDATSAAIRIARAFTEKPKIFQHGYHGWHDWCSPVKNGVLQKSYEDVFPFEYGNLDALEKLFEAHKGEVAAVIVTPVGHELNHPVEAPKEGYLEGVKELAHKNGALLVFDEIRTGFRVSLGGAQKRYGVTPDLATFGKAMANGYPISAVAGRKEVMMAMENKHVFISSTFFPNSLEQVAALKTIEILERDKILDEIWRKGERFLAGVKEAIERTGAKAHLSGIPPMPFITFPQVDDKYRERRTAFCAGAIRRGLFLQPFHHYYICYRHSDKDIEEAIDIIEESLEETVGRVG